MNWSGEQRRMLVAMGFDLLAHASAGSAAAKMARPAAEDAPRRAPIPHESRQPPRDRAAASAAPVTNALDFSQLQRALARAAGGHDLSGLVSDWAGLRREPAAKRALWSRLKVLRRSR